MIAIFLLLTSIQVPFNHSVVAVNPKKNLMEKLDPAVKEIVLKIDETNQNTQTIKADFVQKKELSMLAEPMTLSGEFYLKKGKGMKFNFDAPENLEIFFTQKKIVSVSHNEKTASFKKLPKRKTDITQVLLSEKLDKLLEYFNLTKITGDTPEEVVLLLTPRKRKMKKKFKEIRIAFNKTYMVKRIAVLEVDNDRFEVTLSNIEVNSNLEDALFVPEIPENYESGSKLNPIFGTQIGL
ncbi:MAG: hypothetical protein CSA81_04315 [Acidobacteria bacterium]|nr:MAG: hypothetical protein CSA81_04315 [Acidobacteriota bacterium]